jgi:gamma-glutamyl phosphate reductase
MSWLSVPKVVPVVVDLVEHRKVPLEVIAVAWEARPVLADSQAVLAGQADLLVFGQLAA